MANGVHSPAITLSGELLVSKHIRRLTAILAALAILFVVGRFIFPPKSFWAYGHYRGDSVTEMAAAHPTYLSPETFSTAYPKEYETWSAGIHKVVKCQICHIAADKSVYAASLSGAASRAATTTLPVPADSRRLCVKCHERIAGRPDYMPQIDVASHSNGQACIACHNPHSPLFSVAGGPITPAGGAGAGIADIAAGKNVSATCTGCHGPAGISAVAMFPNLACQKQEYLQGALTDFQNGKRANPVMGGIAKALSVADIKNVSAYFAGLPCRQGS
jgi:cytochrome c553